MRLAPARLLAVLAVTLASAASIRPARAGDGGATGGSRTSGGTGGMGGSMCDAPPGPDGGVVIPESCTPDNFGCSVTTTPTGERGGAALVLLGVAALGVARRQRAIAR
jgi:MYXO-CTERM domain-containing protein